MSLYDDICRDTYAVDEEIEFDPASDTWTVPPQWGLDAPLTGVPSREMALAIARALYASYNDGIAAAGYS